MAQGLLDTEEARSAFLNVRRHGMAQPVAGEIVRTSPLGFHYRVTPERTHALE